MTRKSSRRKHTVHWFRKGLRLSDNPALLRGIRRSESFRCIFILDPWFAGSSNVGTNKWRFLLQCLEDLDTSLRRLDSRLFVIRGQPADVLPALFKDWGTTYFTFEEDPEPFGRVRDQNIVAMCREMGISVTHEHSHTLYNLDKIIELNRGKPPLTYKQFQRIIDGMEAPPKPVPTLTLQMLGASVTPLEDDHDEKFGVPSLEELGFDCESLAPSVWHGGEMEALSRLERHLERKAWVASFGLPRMTPQSLLASQTGLSPYLRFGCLSTRLFYHALSDLYRKIKKCEPPQSLHGQLLWREFFYCAATNNSSFDKMVGNPICVQIPWDTNHEALAKWANGTTGFPWIDAIMTQLRQEGWIHHLARHAVACFLTRGDLWVSWEEGLKVFDELLLDADWSVNAGTWLWLSCSSFFQQFFHCYCPVRFGRKADANGDFIRRYLPALKNFPTCYIHEPWTAPEAVQKSAKCIIGTDYPTPMCDHAYVSKVNMERMKQVYAQLSNYKKTGQTGPGIPGDLMAQMRRVPRLLGQASDPESAGVMGPPNPPDNRKNLQADCENQQLLQHLPNYQGLSHLGLGSLPVHRQPSRVQQAVPYEDGHHGQQANKTAEGPLLEAYPSYHPQAHYPDPSGGPGFDISYSASNPRPGPAPHPHPHPLALPLILGELNFPPPGSPSSVAVASTQSLVGSHGTLEAPSLCGSTEHLDMDHADHVDHADGNIQHHANLRAMDRAGEEDLRAMDGEGEYSGDGGDHHFQLGLEDAQQAEQEGGERGADRMDNYDVALAATYLDLARLGQDTPPQ